MAKKVLIVEDEGVVRERIIQSVRWSKDLILTGEAANGEEALQMCRENMPDIIFADIKMPVMDGIVFAGQVKKMNPYIRIVLLTAYSDFNYARRAIDLNVEKYMLKYEIEPGIINQVIREICAKIDSDNQRISRQEALRRLLFEKLSGTEVRSMLDRAGISWRRVYLCYLGHVTEGDLDRICADFGRKGCRAESRWVSKDGAVIFFGSDHTEKSEKQKWMQEEAEQNKGVIFIDSGEEVLPEQVHAVFMQMQELRSMGLFLEGRGCVSVKVLKNRKRFCYQTGIEKAGNQLAERDFSGAGESMEKLLEEGLNSWNKEGMEECLDALTSLIFEEREKYDSGLTHSYALQLFKRVRECESIACISAVLEGELKLLQRTMKMSRKMCQILSYLDDHYRDNASLEELADRFEWNASYMSQMFRKELGITYKEYVNDLKLRKAKELLLEGKLSIEQIAEQAGYKNVNYFYKVFKRKTGKKPREF